MVSSTISNLENLLINSQLVSRQDIAECRSDVHGGTDEEEYFQILERKQFLTSFQISRIRKGETAGLVLGGCKLLYKNASGSFARVYRGARIATGEMVGVKVLRDHWANDPATIQLFKHEGQVGKKLKHHNIVPIYDVDSQDGFHYITMEFVEGGNLRDFIKIRKKLDPVEACRYTLDIARGLEYAINQGGITHRDMKTTNVLMSSQGVAKLIDFGLAADNSFFNRPGSPDLAQAVEYITIERNTDAPPNDPRSDLFFVGTILYELLAGEPPYPRTRDIDERKRFGRYRDIRPITSILPNLDWSVAEIVDRLLQISPAHRYQSARDLAEEVENVLKKLGHQPTPKKTSSESDGTKTILCVEHRPKRQNVLREYFSKHGFRLLLLSDIERAFNRIKNNPPDGMILFEDAIGDRAIEDFKRIVSMSRGGNLATVLVLAHESAGLADELNAMDESAKALVQPIRLRDLRKTLQKAVGLTVE
ncbi:protein kinase domain-containing protein [Thalassoglobus sp.]|uniref:protein kinase domain-containing protein n=1 Tax=Thalassoglobus sp. TaxID=2795869 RepID=UPI003AA8C229